MESILLKNEQLKKLSKKDIRGKIKKIHHQIFFIIIDSSTICIDKTQCKNSVIHVALIFQIYAKNNYLK